MNNVYENRLEEIIQKYQIKGSNVIDGVVIHNIIMDLFKSRCEGKRTALWGAGRSNSENSHAAVIINKYATYVQSLICIIDSCEEIQGTNFMTLPVISPTEINKNQIDNIIVASKRSAESIKKDIKKYAPQCEVIDIYDELEKKNIDIYYNFFEESSIYTAIFNERKMYEEASNDYEKDKHLKNLISKYLSIRDFYYAFYYIDEYIKKKFSRAIEFLCMKKEIEDLIVEVKRLNAKRSEDVNIYFIDSLRAMDVYSNINSQCVPNMFKSYHQNAIAFTNAYAAGPTTYESMISIITGKSSFEKNVYKNGFIFNYEEFDLLKLAEEKKMEIHFYVSDGYRIIKDDPRIQYTKQLYLTQKLWSVATDMAVSKMPTFNFVYFPCELHFPLICGWHTVKPHIKGFTDVGIEDMADFIEQQFRDCKEYVDKEFEFYKSFFSDDIITVFFSDHSQIVYDKEKQKPFFTYYNDVDRSVHVPFFVSSSKFKPQVIKTLVSMMDFNFIMENVIFRSKLKLPRREYVNYNYYNIHNKKLREYAIKKGYGDYIDGIQCVVSNDYIYALMKNGKEELFNRKNISENIYNEKVKLAEYIKNNYTKEFPEFLDINYVD